VPSHSVALSLEHCRRAPPSAPSCRRPITLSPSLDHIGAQSIACCSAFCRASSDAQTQRPPPTPSVARTHRRRYRPNSCHESVFGELPLLSDPSPGQELRRSRRIPASQAAPMGKDPIVSISIFPGSFVRTEGICVRAKKFPGTSVQNRILNSEPFWLNLVKCLENRTKTIKMQTQFF
jgi:hypothetical protein